MREGIWRKERTYPSNQQGVVVAVCRNPNPGLPKPIADTVQLIQDWGVEGDYHAGKLMRHRYLVKKDATRPNLRQVCLLDACVFSQLVQRGIQIGPGMMGENITLKGLPLMDLIMGTKIAIGKAVVELTEVRTPCLQLNGIDPRLLKAVVTNENGQKVFLAGIMARILQGGQVRAGDQVGIADHTH